MKTRIVFFFQGICWFANFFANVPPTKKGFQKNALVTRSRFFGTFWMLGSLKKPDTQNTGVIQYLLVFNSDLQGKGHSPQQTKNDKNSINNYLPLRNLSTAFQSYSAPHQFCHCQLQHPGHQATCHGRRSWTQPRPRPQRPPWFLIHSFFIPRKSMAYEFPI